MRLFGGHRDDPLGVVGVFFFDEVEGSLLGPSGQGLVGLPALEERLGKLFSCAIQVRDELGVLALVAVGGCARGGS